MFYTDSTGTEYMINLLDTPGHADFSSELLRSLLPSQGALLLVDAAQGIQAQTLSVLESARKRNLKVIGAINKWDLVSSDDRGPRAVTELADLLGCSEDEILKVSAKTGMGVKGVLEGVVRMIPPPEEVGVGAGVTVVGDGSGGTRERMRAIVFDSYFDSYRGVVSLIAVVEGELKRGTSSLLHTTRAMLTRWMTRRLNNLEHNIALLPNPRPRSPLPPRSLTLNLDPPSPFPHPAKRNDRLPHLRNEECSGSVLRRYVFRGGVERGGVGEL